MQYDSVFLFFKDNKLIDFLVLSQYDKVNWTWEISSNEPKIARFNIWDFNISIEPGIHIVPEYDYYKILSYPRYKLVVKHQNLVNKLFFSDNLRSHKFYYDTYSIKRLNTLTPFKYNRITYHKLCQELHFMYLSREVLNITDDTEPFPEEIWLYNVWDLIKSAYNIW